jgi:hypothetical protein
MGEDRDAWKRTPAAEQLKSLQRLDRRLSLGCGAAVGLALGAWAGAAVSWGVMAGAGIVAAAVLGGLCAQFGDRLLERLGRWLEWLS